MKLGDGMLILKTGDRVKSNSDGFTKGWVGTISEFGRGGEDNEIAAFIRFENGGYFAVAVRLLEKV